MSIKKQIEIESLVYDLNEETQTAEVVGCLGIVSTVSIPNTVTFDGLNYTVTEIGEKAFYNCISLESITIPDSVTNIGDRAFAYCSYLESITLPDGVTKIGDHAFMDCKKIESITLPDSVTKIGDYAFYNCDSLNNVDIPDSVTEIGDFAFSYCDSLTEINIPATEKAFPLWVSLMESEYADLIRFV